ncbi:MAG: hypothetical protein NZ895_01590 [Archaeoglobaceae archaeon]|nr:hypothetical protein [Archaeoglobaceae archaeon]MCX8151624.1 hypothetical protein [Archaeoglobaceae archaeon]MDW8013098.1 hypothetical protein [Archaeoglobaceae archaeon]
MDDVRSWKKVESCISEVLIPLKIIALLIAISDQLQRCAERI